MTSGRNRGPQQAAPSGQREAAPSAAAAAAEPALFSAPASASADLLQLQRLIGNQAVGKLLATGAQRQARAAGRSVVLSTREQAPAHTPAAPRGSLLQRLLVKVITGRAAAPPGQASRRVITEIKVEGRAPTTAAKGQGDHTVAETLIVEAINKICLYKGYWEAYSALCAAIPIFAQKNCIDRYDVEALAKELHISQGDFNGLDPEDQLLALENLIDHCIRSANKMGAAAFNRNQGFTTGGGGGSAEKESIRYIREISLRGKLSLGIIPEIAKHLVNLVDYKKFDHQLPALCAREILLAAQAVPALQNHIHLIVPFFAEALVSNRFGGKEEDAQLLSTAIEKALGMPQEEVSLRQVGLTGAGSSSSSAAAAAAAASSASSSGSGVSAPAALADDSIVDVDNDMAYLLEHRLRRQRQSLIHNQMGHAGSAAHQLALHTSTVPNAPTAASAAAAAAAAAAPRPQQTFAHQLALHTSTAPSAPTAASAAAAAAAQSPQHTSGHLLPPSMYGGSGSGTGVLSLPPGSDLGVPPMVQSFLSSGGAHLNPSATGAQSAVLNAYAPLASVPGSAAAGGPTLMPPHQQQLPKALPTGLSAPPNLFGASAAGLAAAAQRPQSTASASSPAAAGGPFLMTPQQQQQQFLMTPQQQQQQLPKALPTGLSAPPNFFGASAAGLAAAAQRPQPSLPAASARGAAMAAAAAPSSAALQQSAPALKPLPKPIILANQPHSVPLGTTLTYNQVLCMVYSVTVGTSGFTYYMLPLG